MKNTRKERLLNRGWEKIFPKTDEKDKEINVVIGRKILKTKFKEVWERHGIEKEDLLIE